MTSSESASRPIGLTPFTRLETGLAPLDSGPLGLGGRKMGDMWSTLRGDPRGEVLGDPRLMFIGGDGRWSLESTDRPENKIS